MNDYIDAFLIPVPRANIDAYRQLEADAWQVWRDHGALGLRVYLADDVPYGEHTSFPRGVALGDDEVVALAFIRYRSRDHRDQVNAAVFADPRMTGMTPADMPFDARRMVFGGFAALLMEERADT